MTNRTQYLINRQDANRKADALIMIAGITIFVAIIAAGVMAQ